MPAENTDDQPLYQGTNRYTPARASCTSTCTAACAKCQTVSVRHSVPTCHNHRLQSAQQGHRLEQEQLQQEVQQGNRKGKHRGPCSPTVLASLSDCATLHKSCQIAQPPPTPQTPSSDRNASLKSLTTSMRQSASDRGMRSVNIMGAHQRKDMPLYIVIASAILKRASSP